MTIDQARTLELADLRNRAAELEQSAEDYQRSGRNNLESAAACRFRAQVLRDAIAHIEKGADR